MEAFDRARASFEEERSALPGREHPLVVIAFAAVVSVLVLILLAGQISGSQRSAQQGLEERHDQRALLAAEFVQQYTAGFAQTIRRHGEVMLASQAPTAQQVADLAQTQNAVAAVVYADDGQTLARYAAGTRASEAVNLARQQVSQLVSSYGVDVRAVPAESSTVGALLVVTASFRPGPGQALRVVSVAVPLAETALATFLGKVVPISGQRSILLDDAGNVLAYTDATGPVATSSADHALVAEARRSPHGKLTVSGTNVYFSSVRLRHPAWSVVIVAPTRNLHAPVDGNRTSAWLVYWVVVAMTVIGVGLFARTLRRERRAERKALFDQLTSVPNRRQLDEALDRIAAQPRGRWGALMIDVDHFKAVNDEFGHAAGDEALRRVAQTIASVVRPEDVVGRWGGEEFLVIVHDGGDSLCEALAERVRAAVEALDDLSSGPLTVSVGWASADRYPPSRVVDQADAAMYEAKRAGRNRVETMPNGR